LSTVLGATALMLVAATVAAEDASFSPRPATPRVAPVPKEGRTEAQTAMLASRPDWNIYRTFAQDTELYNSQSALGQFVLKGSSLPAREREIVILRMGWLCQSEYEWAQHARIAKGEPGLTDTDLRAIAEGPSAPRWSAFERDLLTMVDEIRYEARISDATWKALRGKYSEQQMIEAMYTAAHYQIVSMALNSLGVQLDADLEDRLPNDVSLPKLAGTPTKHPLGSVRLAPMKRIEPQLANGVAANLDALVLHHPKLYGALRQFVGYLRDSHLPSKSRELIIMRTAWLTRAEAVWERHVSLAKANGFTDAEVAGIAQGSDGSWSDEYKPVLRAVDDLRREAFITDATWAALAKHYDTKQLIEIIYTSGGYTMTGVASRSLGVQVENSFTEFAR
jgi:4-carboxymuconolactone decarboxylase